jgi:hypothetical protein
MSNLSKRVEKAKQLEWSHNPYAPAKYGTRGSKGEDYGEKYYHITLSHKKETIITPDGKRNILTLLVDCQKNTGNGALCSCPGNEHHTVCYHGLGALWQSFKGSGKLISFFETYYSANQMAFGGKIVKVQSANGGGSLWAIIKDWPKPKNKLYRFGTETDLTLEEWRGAQEQSIKKQNILDLETNRRLMHGHRDDEGID